jgi:hypothetical protein
VELGAEHVAVGSEVAHPVVHNLGVAQDAEAAEELARDAAHLGPCGIGVDLLKDGADGAAAANGDAEVVDWVGGGVFADSLEFSKDALHGFAEVALGKGRKRNRDGGRQCLIDLDGGL